MMVLTEEQKRQGAGIAVSMKTDGPYIKVEIAFPNMGWPPIPLHSIANGAPLYIIDEEAFQTMKKFHEDRMMANG